MFEDGSWKLEVYHIVASTHHHITNLFYFLTILKLKVEGKNFTVKNLHLPASSIQLFIFRLFH